MRTAFPIAALLLAAAGCGDGPVFVNETPPGTGGYNPGAGGGPGGYGYGASYGQGGGGDIGPPECDPEFRLCGSNFLLPDEGYQSVELRGDFAPDGWEVGVALTMTEGIWQATVEVPWDQPVQYKYIIDTVWQPDPTNPVQVDDGFGSFNSVAEGVTCEEWSCAPPLLGDFDWRDAVLYFVFVDRFVDGDSGNNGPIGGVPTLSNYQGGDWAGLLGKIDEGYFESLGINALWLTVPMDNTEQSGIGTDGMQYSAFHGYWPKDLDAPEERFGTMAELQAVVDAAHAHGLKVIIDYAMNHVHESAPIYQQNPDWFWPLNDNGKYCVCGADCGWDGADGRRCWFTSYLPDFNFTNAAARDFSVSNAIGWIQDLGLDGFRLDAVKHIEDQWLIDLRARVKSEIESQTQQHFYMVGETFTGDKNTIAYYVNPNTMLDGQFDFPLRNAIVNHVLIRNGSMFDLDGFLGGNDGYYGAGIMSTFIGNHDVPRTIHFAQDNPVWSDPWAGGKELAWNNQPGLPSGNSAFERMANGFALIYTLPGVPLVYYGDEVGLPGAGDPDNRRPMQWNGYSSGQQFLKDRLAKLAEIRAAHPATRRGTRTTLNVSNDTLLYRMSTNGDEIFVAINRGDGGATLSGLPAGSFVDAIDGSSHGSDVSVPARSTRILVQQ
jgi:glycosidase